MKFNDIVLIFYYFHFIYSKAEPLRPKYMNSSIIEEGKQVIHEIGPHDIFIFQFEILTGATIVLFHGIEKKLYFIQWMQITLKN